MCPHVVGFKGWAAINWVDLIYSNCLLCRVLTVIGSASRDTSTGCDSNAGDPPNAAKEFCTDTPDDSRCPRLDAGQHGEAAAQGRCHLDRPTAHHQVLPGVQLPGLILGFPNQGETVGEKQGLEIRAV